MGTKLSMAAALLLACVTFSCGDDDDESSRCPKGAGDDAVTCRCDDGSQGTAKCGADGSVGMCECRSDGGTSGSGGRGGSSASGSGGSSASGSGGSSTSGSGGSSTSGSGGSTPGPDEDAGQDPPADAGMDADPDPNPAPTDGNQLAACDNDRDCNMNLGCYGGQNGGFCTRECERDQDCASLQGAEYHCGNSGLCSVECDGPNDDAACPGDLECISVGGGQGGGGQQGGRCLYPADDNDPEPNGPFAECNGGGSCQDGLQCIGDNQDQSGFCSHNCTPEDQDCSDVPAPSGALTASCVPQGPNQGICALDCKANTAGCPTGMECVAQGFYSLCRYAD